MAAKVLHWLAFPVLGGGLFGDSPGLHCTNPPSFPKCALPKLGEKPLAAGLNVSRCGINLG